MWMTISTSWTLYVRAHYESMAWLLVAVAGAGVGMTFGVFGAGGSAFATPVLVLLGVPAPIAIASPLPPCSPPPSWARAST